MLPQLGTAKATAVMALAAAFAPLVSAIDISFCSSDNTGSSGTPNFSIYQSNGNCKTLCDNAGKSFAITQYQNCWCSDTSPSSKLANNKCSTQCPGFTEQCGGPGAFSYIQLGKAKDTASSSASSDPDSSTTSPPSTFSSSTSSTSSTTSFSSSTSSSSSTSNSPKTSAVTSTDANGVVQTVIVTISSTPSPDSSGGLGTGGIVGIVVGVIGGVLVIAGVLLFFFMKKRKEKKEEKFNNGSLQGSGSGSRGRGSPSSPGSAGNRSSMLQIDPRMDPFNQGLYARNGNPSAESVNTLHDDHDYSRRIQARKVLRAVNPDPETAAAAAS